MDFELSAEHQLLRQTIRDFAENEIKPHARELSKTETFSVELTQQMAGLGLLGITIPEAYGGAGMDYLAYIIAMEEIARVDGSQAATLNHNSLGVTPIYQFGTEEQKQRYLPTLTSGGLWGFGLTEADAGSDSRGTKTTAKLLDGNWVINGGKRFITNASNALTVGVTVQARTGGTKEQPELSCILVEMDTPGFTAEPMHGKLMWRASDTSRLFFDDCRVPEENLLGSRGDGARITLSTLDAGRLAIAAMGLGCAQGAFEIAVQYASDRVQFGKPIGKNQGISFPLADLACEIDHARWYLYRACWLKDTGQPFAAEAAKAKLFCSELANRAATQAVQTLGGSGLMEDADVERFFRDARLLTIGEGTSEIQRLVIARSLGL